MTQVTSCKKRHHWPPRPWVWKEAVRDEGRIEAAAAPVRMRGADSIREPFTGHRVVWPSGHFHCCRVQDEEVAADGASGSPRSGPGSATDSWGNFGSLLLPTLWFLDPNLEASCSSDVL